MTQTLKFKITEEEHGQKLLAFLRDRCPKSYSVKLIKRAIDSKQCKVNGAVERFSTRKLSARDFVQIDLEEPVRLNLAILYEDAHLLICNKPASLISENRAFNALLSHPCKGELVHRLDKETTGVIILAKTHEAKEKMERLFAERKIEKLYLCIVDKVVRQERGVIDTQIEGLSACTHWQCKKRGKEASLLLCAPITGRTHQIRIHLSEKGHPILGDWEYAKKFTCKYPAKRTLLHASLLAFIHPITGAPIKIKAPLPDDFKSAYSALFAEK